MLAALPVVAAGPGDATSASMQVSVEVVRSCTVASTPGAPAVTCGTSLASTSAVQQTPAPRVRDALQIDATAAPVRTIEF